MDLHFDGKYFEDNEKDKNGMFSGTEIRSWQIQVFEKLRHNG